MPSDSKKKRDLQKKAAAKQRQGPPGKKSNAANADNNLNDEEFNDENDEGETPNENGTPVEGTNGTASAVDPNVQSLMQNLDLLSMVERANAQARACTGTKANSSLRFFFLMKFFSVLCFRCARKSSSWS